jgi:hypothetical protein
MDPTTIDALTKKWWETRRVEILEAKKARREDPSASVATSVVVASFCC